MSELHCHARVRPKLMWHVLALCFLLQLTGCGGGGGNGGSGPPPPDFSLAVSPTSQSLNPGSSASVSLSATAVNGFSSQINVQVTGVPTGVSVSPTTITLVAGTPQQVTFTVAANAPNANATVTFTGTSGALTHATQLSLSVNSSFGPPGRTQYVRTDASTEYFGWLNQHWILYHASTARYFVSDPSSNEVIVLDGASQTKIATLSVPGAFGMDDTPDHSAIYVGTLIGDVYAIDPVALSVTKRYIGSEIGPYGYLAFSALGLADGRVVLLGAHGGIPSVDGSTSIAVWNPADNSITIYGSDYGAQTSPLPCGGFMGNIGGFTRTVDRTKIIIGSIDSDNTLCLVDPSTGQGNYTGAIGPFPLRHILTSPDGKYLIQPDYPSGAAVYDANTLALVTQFPVLGDTSSASGFFLSADSKTLFTPTDSLIYAYDLATQELIGWVPNIFLTVTSGGGAVGPIDSPFLLATDGTGLFVGPLEEGVGFVDLSSLQGLPVGTQFTNAYLNPAAGPLTGGTQTQWSSQMNANMQGAVYFGGQKSPQVSNSGGLIIATTPPGSAGPVSVYAFSTDGGMQIVPDGFSYGPTILEVTPNMSTTEGGGTGFAYGYGLGPVNSNGIPPDLHVTIAGIAVQVTGFSANAYGLSSPPFQLQSVAFTIPPGVIGPVDLNVTNNYGTTASPGALTYLPSLQQFSLSGAALAQGIYNPHLDVYYFTDATQVQVFSRTKGTWQTSIPIAGSQRLWGIALSPDGTKLAISDALNGQIYFLDPSNPTSVKSFIVGSQGGFLINPCGVAVSDAGNVYYEVYVQGGTGADQFFKLNTNTGVITNYGIDSPGLGVSDVYLRSAISSDNARVFFNDLGYVFSVDTATDKLFSATVDPGCCYGDYDLALSSNQTQFTATSYIYDSDLNGESSYALNDREILNTSYVYGAKLSPDGRLLFQPSANGIDVFDGRVGNLWARISLPISLSPNYDALVADGQDNVLLAITGSTGNGIAIIDLTSLPEPSHVSRDNIFSRPHRLSALGNLRHEYLNHLHPGKQNGHSRSETRTVPRATGTILLHRK